jgi:hypothetical protein
MAAEESALMKFISTLLILSFGAACFGLGDVKHDPSMRWHFLLFSILAIVLLWVICTYCIVSFLPRRGKVLNFLIAVRKKFRTKRSWRESNRAIYTAKTS